MTVFEYEDDIVVVDIGSMFPKEDMPGVDLVIPDYTYLIKNRDRIRGYVITHGHEDHIGSAPYVLKDLPAPLYGTRLTLALVAQKLKEHRYIEGIEMNVVEPETSSPWARSKSNSSRSTIPLPAPARWPSTPRWAR